MPAVVGVDGWRRQLRLFPRHGCLSASHVAILRSFRCHCVLIHSVHHVMSTVMPTSVEYYMFFLKYVVVYSTSHVCVCVCMYCNVGVSNVYVITKHTLRGSLQKCVHTLWQRLRHISIYHWHVCQNSTHIVVIYQPNLSLISAAWDVQPKYGTYLSIYTLMCACRVRVLTLSAVLSEEAWAAAPLQCSHTSLWQPVGRPDQSPVAGQHISCHGWKVRKADKELHGGNTQTSNTGTNYYLNFTDHLLWLKRQYATIWHFLKHATVPTVLLVSVRIWHSFLVVRLLDCSTKTPYSCFKVPMDSHRIPVQCAYRHTQNTNFLTYISYSVSTTEQRW